jgi:hypothetical protein
MGTVWRAKARGFGGFERDVALKVMGGEFETDPAARVMFLDEAELSARVRHPNVVGTLDLGEWEGQLFLVQEWIEGASAEGLARTEERIGGALPEALTLRLLLDALDGLHAAHTATTPDGAALELVHRDVAPDNLLVGRDGWVRIADFGVARAARRRSEATQFGLTKGKAAYAAPEQQGLVRGVSVDARADLWGLGATVYRLLTGRAPFLRVDALEDYVNGTGALPVIGSELSHAWSHWLSRCLAPRPADRFPSAAAWAEEVERAWRTGEAPAPMTRAAAGEFVRVRTERTAIGVNERALDRELDSDAECTQMTEVHDVTTVTEATSVTSVTSANGRGAAVTPSELVLHVVSGDSARAARTMRTLRADGIHAVHMLPATLQAGVDSGAHVLLLADALTGALRTPRAPWFRVLRNALADEAARGRVWAERPPLGPDHARVITATEAALAAYDTDRFAWVTLDARSARAPDADGAAASIRRALAAISEGEGSLRSALSIRGG